MTTRVTIDNTIEWQSAGPVPVAERQQLRQVRGHGPRARRQRNFELTSDNPPNGTREFSANESAAGYGNTVWLRMYRAGQHDPRPVRQGRERAAGRVGDALRLAARSTPPRRVRAPACWSAPYAGGQQNAPVEPDGRVRPRPLHAGHGRAASMTSTRRPRRRRSTARRPRPATPGPSTSRCRRRTASERRRATSSTARAPPARGPSARTARERRAVRGRRRASRSAASSGSSTAPPTRTATSGAIKDARRSRSAPATSPTSTRPTPAARPWVPDAIARRRWARP